MRKSAGRDAVIWLTENSTETVLTASHKFRVRTATIYAAMRSSDNPAFIVERRKLKERAKRNIYDSAIELAALITLLKNPGTTELDAARGWIKYIRRRFPVPGYINADND